MLFHSGDGTPSALGEDGEHQVGPARPPRTWGDALGVHLLRRVRAGEPGARWAVSSAGGDELGEHAMAWRLLTNHMYVLLCLAREPDIRVRDIAAAVGITERATQGILRDLVDGGYIEVTRVGRRNQYRVIESSRFPHPLLAHAEIGSILRMLNRLASE